MQGEKQPLLHAPRGARAPPSAESPLQQRVRGPASLAGADGHSQLPAGWEAYWDEEYKRYYYYNAATGESTWTKPQPEEEEEEEPEPKEEEEPEPQEDAWGDKVPAAAGSDAEGGQEVDNHDGKDAWGDKVARHDGNRRYPTAKQGKPNLDQGEEEEEKEQAGGKVIVCDTGSPGQGFPHGCVTKDVASYEDHSATAHGFGMQPPPARVVRVCSPSLGLGRKGCKLIPDFHRMAADAADAKESEVAEAHELSFLLLKLDVHAETEEELMPYLGNLKKALAKAIGLRFDTDVDHLVLAPALGAQAEDWIEVIKVADLNCTEAHQCEDLGRRRRRRLLSVDAGAREHMADETHEELDAGMPAGRKLLAAPAATAGGQLASWETAIEKEAAKLQSHDAPSPTATAAAKKNAGTKRHPRAAARAAARDMAARAHALQSARSGMRVPVVGSHKSVTPGHAVAAHGAQAAPVKAGAPAATASARARKASGKGGKGGMSWHQLVRHADSQEAAAEAKAKAAASAEVQHEEKKLARKVEAEVSEQMQKAQAAKASREKQLKRLASEAVFQASVQAAVQASQQRRAALQAAEAAKQAKMAELRKQVAREQRKAAMLQAQEAEEETQEEEATEVEMKIYVSRPDDLDKVRKAVLSAVESGAIDAQLLRQQVVGAGPLPLRVGLWRSCEGFNGNGECVLDCHQTCGAFPRPPCQPRPVIDNAYVGEASLEHFDVTDSLDLLPGMDAPPLEQMGAGKDDFQMRFTLDGREPHCGRLKCSMLECNFVAVGDLYRGPIRLQDLLSPQLQDKLPASVNFQAVACDGAHRLSSSVVKATIHVLAPLVNSTAADAQDEGGLGDNGLLNAGTVGHSPAVTRCASVSVCVCVGAWVRGCVGVGVLEAGLMQASVCCKQA